MDVQVTEQNGSVPTRRTGRHLLALLAFIDNGRWQFLSLDYTAILRFTAAQQHAAKDH